MIGCKSAGSLWEVSVAFLVTISFASWSVQWSKAADRSLHAFTTLSPSRAFMNSKTGCKLVLRRKPTSLQAMKGGKIDDQAREKVAKYAIAGLLSIAASSNQQAAASQERVAALISEWNKEYGAQYGQWDMTVYDFGDKAAPAVALQAPPVMVPKKTRTDADPVSQVLAEWNKDFGAEYGVWEPVPVAPAVLSKPLVNLVAGLSEPLSDTLRPLEPDETKPTIRPVTDTPPVKSPVAVRSAGPTVDTTLATAIPALRVTSVLQDMAERSNFFRDLVVPTMVTAYMLGLMSYAIYHYGKRWYSQMAMAAVGLLESKTVTTDKNDKAAKTLPTVIQVPLEAAAVEEPSQLQRDMLVKATAIQVSPVVEILSPADTADQEAPSVVWLPVKGPRPELQAGSGRAMEGSPWGMADPRDAAGNVYQPVECGIDRVATALLESQVAQRERSPMDVILGLQRGNCRFWMGLCDTPLLTPIERRALILAQAPKACVLSCSDSRVPVELVFDQGLGEVFVVRTAGNTLDTAAQGSIEFAVRHLGVKAVIVMGHEGCGAVQGAINLSDDMIAREPSHLASTLSSIRRSLNVEELQHISDTWSREREAIVWNTTNHVQVLQGNPVLQECIASGTLVVCGAYYHVSSGIVDFFSFDKNGFVTDVLA